VSNTYEHKSDFPDIAKVCSAFGGPNDVFAPPVVQDGDKIYSQSIACAMWAGRKAGLTEGVDDVKALQYLLDIIDVMEGGLHGNMEKGGAAFKAFVEGERIGKLLSNLEKGVQGPYWFGSKPSCVDFFWTNICDWFASVVLDRLQAEQGVDLFAAYPKLVGVVSGIRALDSYKACKVASCRDGFQAKDELFEAWKK